MRMFHDGKMGKEWEGKGYLFPTTAQDEPSIVLIGGPALRKETKKEEKGLTTDGYGKERITVKKELSSLLLLIPGKKEEEERERKRPRER